MATIARFEDIEAWRDARNLNKRIYEITSVGPFARDFGFRDQIRRAAVSIMSNISEGFERGSNRDFARFLFRAKRSAGEVRSPLYVAGDPGDLEQEKPPKLSSLSKEFRGGSPASSTIFSLRLEVSQ